MRIPSSQGHLEARLDRPTEPAGIAAVLCHPHPLYGGSLHDGVLDHAARALLGCGVSCLRFNFRGVGASDGRFDGGDGETDDLMDAVAWLRANETPRQLWLAGYSFGAHVVWQALGRGGEADRVLLVAPPVGRMAFAVRRLACPVDVFAGDADEFIDQQALAAWDGVNVHLLAGADHFFVGCGADLERRIELAVG
ncbi:MAG: alpha/beta hydrolase [Pseudomonadales bacterium]|nr:alpha/beta hydrolase [Pseudomonadales bacterium]